jgi:hypothetical protein
LLFGFCRGNTRNETFVLVFAGITVQRSRGTGGRRKGGGVGGSVTKLPPTSGRMLAGVQVGKGEIGGFR